MAEKLGEISINASYHYQGLLCCVGQYHWHIISSVCRAGLIISVMIHSLWQCLYSHILCCQLCSLYTCHGWLNFPFIFSWVIVCAWDSGHTWQCLYCGNLHCILFTTAWTRVIKLCVLCGIVNSRGIFGVSWENNNWKTCIRSIWIQLQSSDTLLLISLSVVL